MAAEASADAGTPNLNLTPEEKRVYGQLFRQADSEGMNLVTGEVAVKFFEKTRLDSRVLGEIWQIADKENRGFLLPAGFGVVLRLIGHAQAGQEPTPELALQPGPLPRFDNFGPALNAAPPSPAAGLQPQSTGIRIPPLTPDKVTQYAGLFERQNLQNGGLLPGDQAKQIFEKSGLSNEILGRIWMLADTEQRGALVLTEFVIAMHLLTSMKNGSLRGLPSVLPAGLYDAATRRGSHGGPIQRQQSPTSGIPPVPPIPRQLSGQAALTQGRTGSPLGRPPLGPPLPGSDWLITPPDKTRFDQLYAELDKGNKGFITGEEAVSFFSQSNLPEDTLAQIWDLADIRSEGRLNRDEFAVAMYLIRQQRNKRDGPAVLPASLPPNLIPPSMRGQTRPSTATTSPFDVPAPAPSPQQQLQPQHQQHQQQQQQQQPKVSALDDLFGLDTSNSVPAQVPLRTGGSNANDPFASNSRSPQAPSSPIKPSPTGAPFKPFIPSSTFGRTLVPQGTGGSNSSASAAAHTPVSRQGPPQPAHVEDDLLGDNEPEVSKNISTETTELANLSNQVGSLSKQMQDVQGQRTATQNELNQSAIQKKKFEERLSLLRGAYENEAREVQLLEQKLSTSKSETKRLQTELAMLEGTFQDLQNQHGQVYGALQADQQENASLKERIRVVNGEISQIKPQIEKLKSEARQQKGLAAINKKQLATSEADRDKLKSEAEDLAKSNEELARQIRSSSPTPNQGQAASPALSTATANNPFFRRTGSTDIVSAMTASPANAFGDKTFDDVFGPAIPAGGQAGGQTSTPPPSAFGKPQNTGASAASVGSFSTPPTSTSPTASRRPTADSFSPFGGGPEPPQASAPAPVEPTGTGQSHGSGSGSGSGTGPDGSKNASTPPADNKTASNSESAFFGAAPADEAKAKEDFESAFASFKSSQPKNPQGSSGADANKSFANFNAEFPPISELEQDDDSDSESERAGFDDDFAPASPQNRSNKESSSKAPSPTLPKTLPAETPASPDTSSTLATERPTSSDGPTAAASSAANNTTNGNHEAAFGSSGASPSAPRAATSATSSTTKGAFDDLDDDFEGLEDAKEGSADDDFANISRSGLDDFNPVFDSSPPPSQAAKSESANTNNAYGVESSFDFGSLSMTSASGSTAPGGTAAPSSAQGSGPGQQQQQAKDTHDWDSLFAATSPSTTASPTTAAPNSGNKGATAKEQSAGRPGGPGRALTEDGEHDDPFLKELVGLGYSRPDALAALEKFNYDVDRAASYLSNES